MFRQLRFLFIFILLGISLTVMPAGQPGLTTLFGPEVFIRGKGAPVTEVTEFSTSGFQGPYILHLRNGDDNGENRVSSATIWLNGEMLFEPSAFSQQVGGYDLEVELESTNKLEVQVASMPGSRLKIWVEGSQIFPDLIFFLDENSSSSATITPENGGIVETFYSGIKYSLLIPPHALLHEKEITLIPITAIIGLPFQSSMEAAVQIMPDGLQLFEPATLTVEFPYPVSENLTGFMCKNSGKGFHLFPIEIADNNLIFRLMHFSSGGAASSNCNDLDTLSTMTEGLSAEEKGLHLIEIQKNRFKRQCDEDMSFYDYAPEVNRILEEWIDNILNQQLKSACNASCESAGSVDDAIVNLKNGINSLFSFMNYIDGDDFVNTLAGYNFDDEVSTGISLISCAFQKIVECLNDLCEQGDESAERKALDLIEFARNLDRGSYKKLIDIDIEGLLNIKDCGIWSLEIVPPKSEVFVGESITLEAIARNKNGEKLTDREVEWINRDPENASLTKTGPMTAKVRGIIPGKVNIEAWTEGDVLYNALAVVWVNDEKNYKINWKASISFSHSCSYIFYGPAGYVWDTTDTYKIVGEWKGEAMITIDTNDIQTCNFLATTAYYDFKFKEVSSVDCGTFTAVTNINEDQIWSFPDLTKYLENNLTLYIRNHPDGRPYVVDLFRWLSLPAQYVFDSLSEGNSCSGPVYIPWHVEGELHGFEIFGDPGIIDANDMEGNSFSFDDYIGGITYGCPGQDSEIANVMWVVNIERIYLIPNE